MESDTVEFILRWAILPLVLVMTWGILKFFRHERHCGERMAEIESKAAVMAAECDAGIENRKTERRELMDAINTHNTNVMNRLTSIEEYLRKNGHGSKA